MEKKVRLFHSFEEAEKADREYDASLTPEQRIEITLELIRQAHPQAVGQGIKRVVHFRKLGDPPIDE